MRAGHCGPKRGSHGKAWTVSCSTYIHIEYGSGSIKTPFSFLLFAKTEIITPDSQKLKSHLQLSKRFSQGIPVWALLGAFSVLLLLVGRAVLGKLWKLSSVPQPPLQLFSVEAAQCCVKGPWVLLKSVAVMIWAAIQNSVGRATDIPDSGEMNLRRTVYCPRWTSAISMMWHQQFGN